MSDENPFEPRKAWECRLCGHTTDSFWGTLKHSIRHDPFVVFAFAVSGERGRREIREQLSDE